MPLSNQPTSQHWSPNAVTFPNEILDLIVDAIRDTWKFDDWYPCLKNLSLVSSVLRLRSQKRLFRAITVDFCSTLNNITNLHETLTDNRQLIQYVHQLSIVNAFDDEEVCGLEPNPEDSYDHRTDCRNGQEEFLAAIIDMLAGSTMRKLEIFSRAHPQHFDEDVFDWAEFTSVLQESLQKAACFSKTLKSLVVVNGVNLPIELAHQSRLEELCLIDSFFDSIESSTSTPNASTTHLKSLTLAMPHDPETQITDFEGITEALNVSGLEMLTVDSDSDSATTLVPELLSPCRDTIRSLRLCCILSEEIALVTGLANCPKLTNLAFVLNLNLAEIRSTPVNPFGILAEYQVPLSLSNLSIVFRVPAPDICPQPDEFTEWAQAWLPSLDESLSKQQWGALHNLDILLCGVHGQNWFSDPFELPATSMPTMFGRGIVRTRTSSEDIFFDTKAFFDRPSRSRSSGGQPEELEEEESDSGSGEPEDEDDS